MTPEQKIKHAILLKAVEGNSYIQQLCRDKILKASNVDELYDLGNDDGQLQDYRNDFRQGEVGTDIPPPYSRHYESKSVAAEMPDGTWVGWTHWYGGGKYAEPEAIDWMDDAYQLDCIEEEKLVLVRTFSKTPDPEIEAAI